MTFEERTKQRVAAFLDRPVMALDGATPLSDLVADSLDLVELTIMLEEELGVHLVESDLQGVHTVGDFIAAVHRRAPRS
jgi:acyl carrier protein